VIPLHLSMELIVKIKAFKDLLCQMILKAFEFKCELVERYLDGDLMRYWKSCQH